MKKLISIIFIMLIFPILMGCNKVSQAKDIKENTKEEKNVLNLSSNDLDSIIYNHKINDKIKKITIKYYKLNNEGKWDTLNYLIDHKPVSGEILISNYKVNEQMEISIKKEAGVLQTISPEIQPTENFSCSQTVWNESPNIELEKEIPLMIEVRTSSNTIEGVDINKFNDPEKLKNYEDVFAITVIFSEKENS
ncbi:hypothetical protein BH721_02130 [Clostridium baratii]|uniref:Putative lipoprotein n=1 Tax=Clostridium baratii TaxID=1561 RepID=A0A174R926_9CLOT|nr:hypothetical protein [Clostridium baratii]OPF51399.1 hypothetical protein A1M12_02345 [Clostridium baratii]OPF55528.1 hypothetical protein BH721_02130 [Clostridium baratii]OPF57093.1 hypothetical protein BH724_11300 [Clostridium baratii]OPF60091.1 hypothetical protein BH725_05795 [Clostridium baratii]CUP79748.1 putative lipoprotein [Clostridium baratii]